MLEDFHGALLHAGAQHLDIAGPEQVQERAQALTARQSVSDQRGPPAHGSLQGVGRPQAGQLGQAPLPNHLPALVGQGGHMRRPYSQVDAQRCQFAS